MDSLAGLMFKGIITRFQPRIIRLETDPSLQGQIAIDYRSNSPIDFRFRLFDLIYAIGTCRTVSRTKTNKFSLALDFLRVFAGNSANELRIVQDLDIEQKQAISRYVGEGLSLVIAEKLYSLRKSTIRRIQRRRNESKPDFVGFSPPLKVVWEAKGSTDVIRPDEIARAINQKAREPADIAFASFATLNSESITEVRLEDPPTLPLGGDHLKQQLSRVLHYVNVFNFIGQTELSRYFELLGKRLEHDRRFPEFHEKIELFERIKEESIKLTINRKCYLGNIERVGDSVFFYVGFDEELLSISYFLSFIDYEEDFRFEQDGNTFRVTRDGICYGYLRDLDKLRDLGFTREIDIQEIPYYRDTLSILDLDDMLHFQLVEHIEYLFRREGFGVSREPFEDNKRYDLIVSKEGNRFIVEIKKNLIKSFEMLKDSKTADAALLITTMNVSDGDILYAKSFNVLILDRKSLKAILRKRKRITDFLKELST